MENLNTIPTAEEFIDKEYYHIKLDLNKTDSYINISDIYQAMIEFAKLHVEQALKEASEQAETDYTYEGESGEFEDIPVYNYFVNIDSILNSYPLTLIK